MPKCHIKDFVFYKFVLSFGCAYLYKGGEGKGVGGG